MRTCRKIGCKIALGCIGAAFWINANAHSDHAAQSCVAPGVWQVLRGSDDAKVTPGAEVMQRAARQRVVLLGEDHDNAEHHRWQLHTIIALHALQPDMVMGFESFPRRVQPVLDRWVAGEMSEAEFLKAVDWKSIWNYDAALYLPMFHFARQQRIPLIALNVQRDLISKTTEKGWENVATADREGLTDPAPPMQEYRDMLQQVFKQHQNPHHGQHAGKEKPATDIEQATQRFIQGQQVWDRAMAEGLSNALKRTGAKLAIGVMGAGHVMHGYGVPHQLRALGVAEQMSLLPWDGAIECEELKQQVADAVFGLRPQDVAATHAKPKLGVYLERTADGVRVGKLTPNSVAVEAGLKAGDIVLQAAGRTVEDVADVVSTVQSTPPGVWLPLRVKRDKKTLDIVAKFPATPALVKE